MDEIIQQKWFVVGFPSESRFLEFSKKSGKGAFLCFNYFSESGTFPISLIYSKIDETKTKKFTIQKNGESYSLVDEKGEIAFVKDQTNFTGFIDTITFTNFYDGDKVLKPIFLEKVSRTEELKGYMEVVEEKSKKIRNSDKNFSEIVASINAKYDLHIEEPEIGQGTFGRVFKGKLKGKPIVVKILRQHFDHTILREYSSHRLNIN